MDHCCLVRCFGVVAGVLVFALAPLAADVSVSRLIKTSGFGGMGDSQTESTDHVQGTRKRSDATVKYENGIMNRMAGGQRSEITLVTEDKVYTIDHKRKAFQERTITAAAEELKKAQASQGKAAKPTHRVTRADFKAQPTGEKKTINGFPCEKYLVTMSIEAEDLKSKQKSTSEMKMENWTAPETAALKALSAEEMAFYTAYLKKLGWEISPRDSETFGLTMASAMMGFPEDELKPKMADLKKEMAKMKGYPIVSEVKWFSSALAGAAAPPSAKEPEQEESMDFGGGASGILGGMAGKLAKKKASQSAAKREPEPAGPKPLLSTYTEIREVKKADVAADMFAPPAGYKLEKGK